MVDGDTKNIEKLITGDLFFKFDSLSPSRNVPNCSKFSAVDMHPSLTSLSLARDPRRARFEGGVSVTAISSLVKVLPTTNIDHLSLAFNRVGDSGLGLIAASLKSTKLKTLDLDNADINRAGAEALANVLKEDDTELSTVNLSNNKVGGAVELLLEAAKTHSKLTQVGDEGTTVSHCRIFVLALFLSQL